MGPIKIRINKIELLSKSLLDKPNDFIGNDIQYLYNINNHISFEEKGIRNICQIAFKERGKEYELAKFTISSLYEVYEFDNVFKKNTKIPPDLDLNFIFISYNTIRGVIFSELSGTYLDKAVLPLMDVNELRKKQQEDERV